jgi:hypothetical protein
MADLTHEQRSRISEFLAEYWLNAMSLRDLERYFLEDNLEFLKGYADDELLQELEGLTDEEQYNQLLKG